MWNIQSPIQAWTLATQLKYFSINRLETERDIPTNANTIDVTYALIKTNNHTATHTHWGRRKKDIPNNRQTVRVVLV